MKKVIPFLVLCAFCHSQAEAARGRQPCSGSKGGIAHCTSDGRFACNDGSLSQSKRLCSGYGESRAPQKIKTSTSAGKTQTRKAPTKQYQQAESGSDEQNHTLPRQPSCAPLYMASKPGFTHLPICSGNQY